MESQKELAKSRQPQGEESPKSKSRNKRKRIYSIVSVNSANFIDKFEVGGVQVTLTKEAAIVHRMFADNVYYAGSAYYALIEEYHNILQKKDDEKDKFDRDLQTVGENSIALIAYADQFSRDHILMAKTFNFIVSYWEGQVRFYSDKKNLGVDDPKELMKLWAEYNVSEMLKDASAEEEAKKSEEKVAE